MPGEEFETKPRETTAEMYRDPFIGHVLTPERIKPDPGKVEAVLKMERPSDVVAVRRLVGLVNYLSKFLRKLSERCEPLDDSPTRASSGTGQPSKRKPLKV